MLFTDLQLIKPILDALIQEGYEKPTPIQSQAIPHLLEGKDLLGTAQTGTGKTAAFAIPILQNLYHKNTKNHQIKALILTPTRELAIQIEESFKAYGRHLPLKTLVIFGGVKQGAQEQALKNGVDILVATPGRLLDFINQGIISLKNLEIFVLDEADRMLDMGFVDDINKIITFLPKERQTLLFSATMPPKIRQLAARLLVNPEQISLAVSKPAEGVTQNAYLVYDAQKNSLVARILKEKKLSSVIIFSGTKQKVKELETENAQFFRGSADRIFSVHHRGRGHRC